MTTNTPFNLQEQQALVAALDDVYKSHETCQGVIRDFGLVRPFINIVQAEARHFSALLALFAKYAVSPPPNEWRDQAPRCAQRG